MNATSRRTGFSVEEIWSHIITGIVGLLSALLGGAGVWYRTRREQHTKQLEATATADAEKYRADTSKEISLLEATMARIGALEDHNKEQDQTIERLVRENAKLSAQVDLLTQQNKVLLEDLQRTKKQRDQALARADQAEQKAAGLNDYIQNELSEAVQRVDTLEMESDAQHERRKEDS